MQSGETCLVISLLLLSLGGHTRGDGEFWWMGTGAFQGDTSGGNVGYGGSNDVGNNGGGGYSDGGNNVNIENNVQSNPGFTLPATQGLVTSNSKVSSCPPVTQLPFSECTGRTSNCWSVGQPDVDCINNAVCCFDGCANVCQGAGSRSPVSPPAPTQQFVQASPAQSQQNNQNIQQQYPQKTNPIQQQYPKKSNHVQKQHKKKTVQVQQQQRPKTVKVQQQYPQQTVQQQQQQPIRQVIPASTKPFLQCPAAMKCVPKINCDLLGVMRNQDFNFTPQQEMLRVQLNTCINSDAGNRVDVCCRDPNYKDPWPNMNNNNQGQVVNTGVNQGVNQGISPRGGNNKKKQNKKKNNKNGGYSWMNNKNMFG